MYCTIKYMSTQIDLSDIEGFEWDEGNLTHINKHRVEYFECEQILFNIPLLIDEDKTHSQNEQRLKALGQTNNNRLLLLIFIIRTNKIRVISARDQNKKERKKFKEIGGI